MNRTYTKEEFLNLVNMIKQYMPDCSISTDIIVGFPGETDEEFNETLEVVSKVQFDSSFMFKYSSRPGTKAAEYTDQIDEEIKQSRLETLISFQQKISLIKNRKKIGGSIINMSSQMGHVGGPNRSVYNMTKFGLEGLTKGMAIDLAKHNVRVNTVCPTFVYTPMTKKFLRDKGFKKEVMNNIPLGRFATVSDVATVVVFLSSDASSMITGSSILVDGGWTAH